MMDKDIRYDDFKAYNVELVPLLVILENSYSSNPPLHPWCRCTIYTDVDDEGDELTNEELEELEMVTYTENEEQKKKRLYENTAVDFNYINSSSYRRKFDKLDDDEHINRAIYNASKKNIGTSRWNKI